MNNFLSSLNNRERNLVLATLLMVVTLILFFIFTNTIQSLNFSSKKLEKAKSDYEYVVLKAQQLSNSFINQSNDPAEIKSFIDNSIDLDIKNLEVDNIDNYLKISFENKLGCPFIVRKVWWTLFKKGISTFLSFFSRIE